VFLRKLSAIAKHIQGPLFQIKEEELDMEFLNMGYNKHVENPPQLFNATQRQKYNGSFDLTDDTPYTPYSPASGATGSPLKRNAENIHTPSPVKRAKRVADLEELVYKDEYEFEGEGLSDSKIIELQMMTIANLERENKKLLDLYRSQARRRMNFLSEVVRAKGRQLQAHGEFLANLAQAELDKE
jgi:hypothetical protein